MFRPSLNKIAVSWSELGDFPTDGDWEVFRARVKDLLPPDYSAQRVGAAAGQLWAFIRDMVPGDYVISPVKISREVLVGCVVGDYRYDVAFDGLYSRTRTVDWYAPLAWDKLSGPLRSTFSAWQTISHPSKDFAQVIEQAKNPTLVQLQSGIQELTKLDSTESNDEDLSERAEEAIRQKLLKLSHVDFHRIVGGIFAATGFTVLYDSAGKWRDGGVDIILSKDQLGVGDKIIVQVKHTDSPVGQPELQQLLGTLKPREWGLMVSSRGVNTNSDRYWRDNRDRLLRPLESVDLIKLLQENYEHLADEFKTLLPLKRTYVPFMSESE